MSKKEDVNKILAGVLKVFLKEGNVPEGVFLQISGFIPNKDGVNAIETFFPEGKSFRDAYYNFTNMLYQQTGSENLFPPLFANMLVSSNQVQVLEVIAEYVEFLHKGIMQKKVEDIDGDDLDGVNYLIEVHKKIFELERNIHRRLTEIKDKADPLNRKGGSDDK